MTCIVWAVGDRVRLGPQHWLVMRGNVLSGFETTIVRVTPEDGWTSPVSGFAAGIMLGHREFDPMEAVKLAPKSKRTFYADTTSRRIQKHSTTFCSTKLRATTLVEAYQIAESKGWAL